MRSIACKTFPPEQIIFLVELDELEGGARPVSLLLGKVVKFVCANENGTAQSAPQHPRAQRRPFATGPQVSLLGRHELTETRRSELRLLAHLCCATDEHVK